MITGIAKAIALAGGTQTALGKVLNLTPQCIQRWEAQGHPSAKGAIAIERAYPGRITLAELHPALFA